MTGTTVELASRLRAAVEESDYTLALSTLAILGEGLRTQPVSLDIVAEVRDLLDWALTAVRAQRAHLARDLTDLEHALPYLKPSSPQQPMLNLRA